MTAFLHAGAHKLTTDTDLSSDANVLFTSDSLVDILGYQPHEVQGTSVFDYFHPDEVLAARLVHRRSVLLDKAAALHYARLLHKDGRWVSCECCLTVVSDVLVACTRVYRRGKKSESASQDDFHIDCLLRTLLIAIRTSDRGAPYTENILLLAKGSPLPHAGIPIAHIQSAANGAGTPGGLGPEQVYANVNRHVCNERRIFNTWYWTRSTPGQKCLRIYRRKLLARRHPMF